MYKYIYVFAFIGACACSNIFYEISFMADNYIFYICLIVNLILTCGDGTTNQKFIGSNYGCHNNNLFSK